MSIKKQLANRGIRLSQLAREAKVSRMTIDRINAGYPTTLTTANALALAARRLCQDESITYHDLDISVV